MDERESRCSEKGSGQRYHGTSGPPKDSSILGERHDITAAYERADHTGWLSSLCAQREDKRKRPTRVVRDAGVYFDHTTCKLEQFQI